MPKLRLYYPIKPHTLNQPFGANLPCVKDFGLPTQSIITGSDNNSCPVGYEKLYPRFGLSGHNGLDLNSGEQNCYASCDGVVVEKQSVPARGLGLGILTNEPVELNQVSNHYIKIRYWHLKTIYKEVGDSVKAGDLIGVTDNTGYSSGNHLHFEGQPMDKDAGGHPFLAFPNNGIGGAIDLAPYFNGIYAESIPQLISLNKILVEILIRLLAYLKK